MVNLKGRILTKEFTAKWGGMPYCHVCGSVIEDIIHVFRDCRNAKAIWETWLVGALRTDFFSLDVNEWIRKNLLGGWKHNQVLEWKDVFITTIWKLWEEYDVSNSNTEVESRDRWSAPANGWWKMNIDGAVEKVSNNATKLIVEGDSSLAMGAIEEGEDNGDDAQLVKSIRNWLNLNWEIKLVAVRRKANRCADFLAHFSCNLDDVLVMHLEPPVRLEWLLAQDAGAVSN
ncbi:uncharacterized protein LOC133299967 [Gastrolobium bilobum]|uniref:uncharacterized protein LOC133299967 n=1 Tax=Gastrolobium bilobum TaxID=150636 RepID=UPI002AB240D2|nr:uncharacterized protein LOC133299967 [Gastrolobium bilobum]